jgi:hypothetical protein
MYRQAVGGWLVGCSDRQAGTKGTGLCSAAGSRSWPLACILHGCTQGSIWVCWGGRPRCCMHVVFVPNSHAWAMLSLTGVLVSPNSGCLLAVLLVCMGVASVLGVAGRQLICLNRRFLYSTMSPIAILIS